MLRIRLICPIIIPVVVIGGLIYPILGYLLLLDMLLLIGISPSKGRWFCGNLCSRGIFNDLVLSKISRKIKIPKLFYNSGFRIALLIIMMGFMVFRIIGSEGVFVKLGGIFVGIYIMQTLIISVIAIFVSPRAWCQICPAGTLQRLFDLKKNTIVVDKEKCIDCGLCSKVCPMHLKVNEIKYKPDCIKCGRCIDVCPKNALKYSRQ
ncbi:4Fe-4S binding protein [Candidatus Woesearchaeota archaeon]|nr:4Fe-4S binding protein [Candidatus Woesearchaeota archaeon]